MASYTPRFQPFQPSNLRFPTGPSSPASPLSPPPLTVDRSISPILPETGKYSSLLSSAPPSPKPWRWSCHKCHQRYRLGATSRCLNDGHKICFFPVEKVSKRTGMCKQRQPCTTQFDYGGWKVWNEWRRRHFPGHPTNDGRRIRDCCRTCDYPSQCTENHSAPSTPVIEPLRNHDSRPTAPIVPRAVSQPTSPPASPGPCTTFEQILGPLAPAIPPTSPARISNQVSGTFDRLIKAAGIGRAQLATLLSPILEENRIIQQKPMTPITAHETTTPVAVPSPAAVLQPSTSTTRTTSGSKQNGNEAAARAEVLSPAGVEDFQSFKARMDRIHGASGGDHQPRPAHETPSVVADDVMAPSWGIVIPPRQRSRRRSRTPPPSAVEYLELSWTD
ncbi:hypothetical protein MMC07_002210 [Pseudocyphellaria aurata]|nr:hypothetical protein [Pseudocyphellaria aurata]